MIAPEAALAALDATWAAAARRAVGGWTARRGMGGGNRVSSALPGPTDDLDATLAALAAVCADWDQPSQAQIGPADAALDAALGARGWRAHDRSVILAADPAALAAASDPRMVVRVRAPLAALCELWAAGGVGPERRAVMERTPGPKEVLMLREDDRPAALAFVAAAGGVAMLHAVHVDESRRRRGLGRAVAAAAARWARAEAGATTLALAVAEANAPARALYAALGFETVCRYHYRVL